MRPIIKKHKNILAATYKAKGDSLKSFLFFVHVFIAMSVTAHADQVLNCKGVDQNPYKVTIRLANNNNRLAKSDLRQIKIKEGTRPVELNALYLRFANGSTDSTFKQATRLEFAGYREDAGLRFDAYHFKMPIYFWNKNVLHVPLEGWFQDTSIGGGSTYKFDCSSQLLN